MTGTRSSYSAVFRSLCRVLGGRDQAALRDCLDAGLFPQLMELAQAHDVLPALAVRCNEQDSARGMIDAECFARLKESLLDNTRRNMTIVAQALKLTGQLNRAGVTPLFLKGTARLLTLNDVDLGFRKQVDIDLLVPTGDLVAAGNALLADGYRFGQVLEKNQVVVPVSMSAAGAVAQSAAHHHLPPLVKEQYTAVVELHRHNLTGRFQRANPIEPLFASARRVERNGAVFMVPSTDYQLIHLVLGTWVNDGHLARRSFPVRDACDLIELLELDGGDIDRELISRRCGSKFELICGLVAELMGSVSDGVDHGDGAANRYLRLLLKRHDSPVVCKVLDAYARAEYLFYEFLYSPAKFPAFLARHTLPNR